MRYEVKTISRKRTLLRKIATHPDSSDTVVEGFDVARLLVALELIGRYTRWPYVCKAPNGNHLVHNFTYDQREEREELVCLNNPDDYTRTNDRRWYIKVSYDDVSWEVKNREGAFSRSIVDGRGPNGKTPTTVFLKVRDIHVGPADREKEICAVLEHYHSLLVNLERHTGTLRAWQESGIHMKLSCSCYHNVDIPSGEIVSRLRSEGPTADVAARLRCSCCGKLGTAKLLPRLAL